MTKKEEYKPSTLRYAAVAIVAVLLVINIISLILQGGPKTGEDYLAIVLILGCVFLSGLIIRNEKKRKREFEERQQARIDKKQHRRDNKKKK